MPVGVGWSDMLFRRPVPVTASLTFCETSWRLSSKVSWVKSSVWISVGCSISVRHFQTENVCLCLVVAGVLETVSEEDRDAIKKAKILYSSCMNESKAVYKGAREHKIH